MIRDPSDGTVREEATCKESLQVQSGVHSGPVLETKTSGLPINKSKTEYLERLERSRVWLREYFDSIDPMINGDR